MYAAIKLLAPFFELAEPGGALAEKAFGLYYLSSGLRPTTLLALTNVLRIGRASVSIRLLV
jgi:hypothetical protein